MIEIFLVALVALVVVMSVRRWTQTRRGHTGDASLDDSLSFRDSNFVSRRRNDSEFGQGPY